MQRTTKSTIAAATAAAMAIGACLGTASSAIAEPGYHGSVYLVGGKKHNWHKKGHWNKKGHWHYNYNNWVGPAIGFGAGVFVGSLLAPRYYYSPAPRYRAPRYVGPVYGYPNRDAYCHAKYRSYNSYTKTYTGYDGRQHYCRIP